MKRWALLLLLFCGGGEMAGADDITLVDGTVYRKATIVKHDAVNATILYADGGVTVPISQLPEGLQKTLGYDATVAEAELNKAAAGRAAAFAKRRAAEVEYGSGPIQAVRPEGLLIELSTVAAEKTYLGLALVRCDTNGLVAGKHWEGKIWPDGGYVYEDGSGEKRVILKFTAIEAEALAEPGGK